MSFWQNPAVVGLILAIPGAIFAYLAYRRSLRVDKAAEQAGLANIHGNEIGQIIAGLNNVITAVQSDNDDLREAVGKISTRLDIVESGNIDLRAKLRESERENSVLHGENEAFKIEIAALTKRIAELEKNNGRGNAH